MTLFKIIGSTALSVMLFTGCSSEMNETPATTSSINQTSSPISVVQSSEISTLGNYAAILSSNTLAKRSPSLAQYTVSDEEALRALKVKIATNPDAVSKNSAETIVRYAAQDLLGKTVNGQKVTQSDINSFMNNIDSDGLFFIALMEAYAKQHNLDNTEVSASSSSARKASSLQRGISLTDNPLLDAVKDSVVSLVGQDAVTDLTADAFRLALQSEGITTAMLDMAINSETITDIMVTVMVDNWDLTTPMIPMMLNPENDYEFTRKFLTLALAHNKQIGKMTFSYIDEPLYGAITQVMALSTQVNTQMGEVMVAIGVNHFLIPSDTHTLERRDEPDLYAGADAFARLMVDINNSLVNERLFYSLFAKSDTTAAFVNTMQQVKSKDEATAVFFMDTIFLGGTLEGNVTIDEAHKDQAMKNIYAITKAMMDGYNAEGLAPYSPSFVGFAGLIPFDRYIPYAKGMATAGYYYAKTHGFEMTGTAGTWIKDKFFPDEDQQAQQASLRKASSLDGTVTEAEETILTSIIAYFDDLFGSYSTWLSDTNDYLSGTGFGQGITTVFDGVVGVITDSIDTIIADLTAAGHDYTEAKISVVINDANYTLPPFEDITLDYILETSKTTALSIFEDPEMVRYISDANATQQVYAYINEKLETNYYLGYIPHWMTQLDWLELPANIDSRPTAVVNFAQGSVDFYILSDNGDMIDLQTNVLGNQVLLTEVSIDDAPLSVNEEYNNIDTLFVYKFTIRATDVIDINLVLASLGTYLDSNFGAVAVDASSAIVETPNN